MDNYAYQPEESNTKVFAITRYPSTERTNNYLVEVNTRSKLLRKPKFYKTLIGILVILILILIAVLVVVSLKYYAKDNICTTEECLRSAANLRLSLDFSADPCDDFYKFTCGRWSKEHPSHGWFPSFSSFTTIYEKVLLASEEFLNSDASKDEPLPVRQTRDFYQSCLDDDARDLLGFSSLYKYLQATGLPLVPSLFTKKDQEIEDFKFDWLKTEASIKKIFVQDILIGFNVQANTFNRSENVMFLGVPVNMSPLPSPIKREEKRISKKAKDEEILKREANARIIKFVLKSLIKNVTEIEPEEDNLHLAAEVLLNMTSFIDELVSEHIELTEEYGDPYSIREFQTKTNEVLKNNISKDYPDIYEKYLSYLFEETNITIDFDKDLFYMDKLDYDYLPKVIIYILTTPDIHVELYMWWVTVYTMIINTTSDMAEYIYKQTAPLVYTGEPIVRPRSLDCAALVNTFMGMAVSYGLADRTFSNRTKPKIERMLYDIKDAFMEHVNSLTWMDKNTKSATLEKSKEMISFIGYPDWLFDKGALEMYYQEIDIKNDTLLDNMMALITKVLPSKLEALRVANNRTWSTDPITVNAYNSFGDNAINVPMGIISFPIYNLGLEVLNYGAIGSILGHELTHGFDNSGRKHDKFGNYKQWWTNETINTFEEKIQCFIRQYDNFTFEELDDHVHGEQTLGENIADNGGLNHAFRAYQKFSKTSGKEAQLPGFHNFTHNQLFFVAFGSIWCETQSLEDLQNQLIYDEHTPNSVRVVATLQNSNDFSKAFNCPPGSNMNPKRGKCKVW